jgi:hypothetical protein
MKPSVVTAAAVCGTIATVFFAWAADARSREDAVLHRAEATTLRAHFDSVLAELRARDIADLRPRQRLARAELLRALARYRDGGVFPHNHDFAGVAVPYFRDEHGTLCAMAYLVATTGRHDIVDAVAAHRNNEYIPELATDMRLGAWLDSVGLTVAEAARIQPTYGGPPPPIVERESGRRYVVPSVVVGATAVVSAAINWSARPEQKGKRALLIGALSGAVSTFLGAAILGKDDDDTRALGAFDITVGVAALGAAVQRGVRRARPVGSPPPVVTSESRVSFQVIPALHSGRVAPASVVRLRF